MTVNLWPGDRVKWRQVEFTVYSTWQDGTVDLWDEGNDALIENLIENVKASEVERVVK